MRSPKLALQGQDSKTFQFLRLKTLNTSTRNQSCVSSDSIGKRKYLVAARSSWNSQVSASVASTSRSNGAVCWLTKPFTKGGDATVNLEESVASSGRGKSTLPAATNRCLRTPDEEANG